MRINCSQTWFINPLIDKQDLLQFIVYARWYLFCWTGGTKIPAAKGSFKRGNWFPWQADGGPVRGAMRHAKGQCGKHQRLHSRKFLGKVRVLGMCWISVDHLDHLDHGHHGHHGHHGPCHADFKADGCSPVMCTWRPIYNQASASRILWNCLMLIQCHDQESKAPIMGMTIKHGLWPITVPPAHITSLGFPNLPKKGNK